VRKILLIMVLAWPATAFAGDMRVDALGVGIEVAGLASFAKRSEPVWGHSACQAAPRCVEAGAGESKPLGDLMTGVAVLGATSLAGTALFQWLGLDVETLPAAGVAPMNGGFVLVARARL
jgi:hypothetical protein